jgi:hypothetical protein
MENGQGTRERLGVMSRLPSSIFHPQFFGVFGVFRGLVVTKLLENF